VSPPDRGPAVAGPEIAVPVTDGAGHGLLLEPGSRAAVTRFLEPRSTVHDAVVRPEAATIREALAFLQAQIPDGAGRGDGPNGDLGTVAATIATAAWSDLSVAFTLWCHRMVLEYLWCAPAASTLRTTVLPAVARTELLGSTALAAAMAHHVAGTPLPVTWRPEGDGLALDGRVSWASNLFPPDFVLVTGAAHVHDGRVLIVALPGDAPGVAIDPYPRLLALQATGSSSLALRGVRVGPERVISADARGFLTRVRPTFLLLQTSFCLGLAARALAEARAALRGPYEVFRADLAALESRAAELVSQLRTGVRERGASVAIREHVELRLGAARLATAAVALEAKVAGGRGYLMTSPTARRLREAAFLPVQAPTEGQLRWELSRFA
jgi:alkylation response protein AidB-like acyl-CoA dehydrogenase